MINILFSFKKPQHLAKLERIQTIDLIRGVDIILMVLFNYSVTLSYFRLLYIQSSFLYWFIFPRAIASIFIFLSGVVAYTSYENHRGNFNKKYFKRGLILLIFATFITLSTYIFVPEGTIFFGILHFFAVSSFLVPFFIKYNKLNLIIGLLITLFGSYLQLTEFNFSYLFWLGFIPKDLFTFDYFPLMPWLGVLLLGIYYGKYITRKTANTKFKSKLGSIFIFLGKKSFIIYLIHQPLLILFLIVWGFKLF